MGPWAFPRRREPSHATDYRKRSRSNPPIEHARRGEAVSSHRSGVVPASAFVPARLDAILAASVALAAASPTEERKRSFFSARDGHSALVLTLPRRRLGRGRTTQAFARAMAFDAFERSARPRLEAAAAAWRRREATVVRREAEEGPARARVLPRVASGGCARVGRRGAVAARGRPPRARAAERARRGQAPRRAEPDAGRGSDPSAAAKKYITRRRRIPRRSSRERTAATRTRGGGEDASVPVSVPRGEDVVWLVAAWTDAVGEVFATEAGRSPPGASEESTGPAFAWLARRTAALAYAAERARRNRRVGPRRRSWVAVQTRGLRARARRRGARRPGGGGGRRTRRRRRTSESSRGARGVRARRRRSRNRNRRRRVLLSRDRARGDRNRGPGSRPGS